MPADHPTMSGIQNEAYCTRLVLDWHLKSLYNKSSVGTHCLVARAHIFGLSLVSVFPGSRHQVAQERTPSALCDKKMTAKLSSCVDDWKTMKSTSPG